MTKKKTNLALWTVICLVSILAVGTIAVFAFSGTANTNIERADVVNINNPVQPEDQPALGSVSSPNITSQYLCVNNDCTYHITGTFKDATTTIVAFPDPFTRATTTAGDVVLDGTTNNGYGLTGATSTVDLIRLDITGVATSSYGIECGVSVYDGTNGASRSSVDLLDVADFGIATSSSGIAENNLTAALGGIADAGTVAKVTLNGDYPYFTCFVITNYAGAFTGTNNTFDGTFAARVHKTIKTD